jgi:photosystem II stability/assembly factor-like uncharacterized protein
MIRFPFSGLVMKRVSVALTVLCIALLTMSVRSNGQDGWIWQNPLPTGNFLKGITYLDTGVGIAVGMHGTILRTTDGGTHWTTCASGTEFPLLAVSSKHASVAYIVGERGTILRSKDRGANWNMQRSGTLLHLRGVSVLDANLGIAVGDSGAILRTTNAGQNWIRHSSGVTSPLRGVCFTDANTGTVVGDNGTILRTTNGGIVWNAQSGPVRADLHAVFFFDANTGTAVGCTLKSGDPEFDVVFRTTDGGEHWSRQSTGIKNRTHTLAAVFFTDTNAGTIVSSGGLILRTKDGGGTWSSLSGLTVEYISLRGVSFSTATNGSAVGDGGVIFHTTDGGQTWAQSLTSTFTRLTGVSFHDSNWGVAISWDYYGDHCVHYTRDGGAHWSNRRVENDYLFNAVQVLDSNKWIAAETRGHIMQSTDAGASWVSIGFVDSWPLNGISFSDSMNGTVVGGHTRLPGEPSNRTSRILRTTDGGKNWNRQMTTTASTWELNAVSFADSSCGVVLGDGVIFRTTDGGASWQMAENPVTSQLNGICMTTKENGTAVGNGGIILRTTDGGYMWRIMKGVTTVNLNAVSFGDSSHGTIVGESGTIFHTSDGGLTWVAQKSGTALELAGVCFTDARTGTVVGAYGTILRTTTGGEYVPYVSPPVVYPIALGQNYPNPAGSATSIPFSIDKDGRVMVLVYDMLGRQVAVVTDAELHAGRHIAPFNAAGLAQGMYCIVLRAGSAVETRMMIVLR